MVIEDHKIRIIFFFIFYRGEILFMKIVSLLIPFEMQKPHLGPEKALFEASDRWVVDIREANQKILSFEAAVFCKRVSKREETLCRPGMEEERRLFL